MISKSVFKVTDTVSKIIEDMHGFQPGIHYGVNILGQVSSWGTPKIEDTQEQIDNIVDSIENKYASGYVFDQWQDMTTEVPFYFYWEIPLGTVEIISARLSFEVKTGTGTINFTISEDKGALYGNNYGPYTTDMRAIDILGDLTGEGIKIIKFTTSANVTLTARVFLRVRISKKETPDAVSERPEVRTLVATSIVNVSATLNGDIVSVGKGTYVDHSTGEIKPVTCTKRGFKYGLTMTDTWDTNESDTYVRGTFGISATGLTPETDYYFRAYADNQYGRSYGEYMKLTTTVAVPAIYLAYENAVTSKRYINVYNSGGTYIEQWEIELTELYYGNNVLCVDVDGNVYTVDGDNHGISKRNSSGTLTLNKNEANYIYNIATGPDGFIYTIEYDSAFNNGYISKRNASDLVSVDTEVIDPGGVKSNAWEGFVIDSDGKFYLTNASDDRYEEWTWGDGMTDSHDGVNAIRSGGLGVAGTKLGSLDRLGKHAITILKSLGDDEADDDLDDITRPAKVGTISGYLLYTGDDESSNLWIGKYNSSLVKQWTVMLASSTNFSVASIAAYPF